MKVKSRKKRKKLGNLVFKYSKGVRYPSPKNKLNAFFKMSQAGIKASLAGKRLAEALKLIKQ